MFISSHWMLYKYVRGLSDGMFKGRSFVLHYRPHVESCTLDKTKNNSRIRTFIATILFIVVIEKREIK